MTHKLVTVVPNSGAEAYSIVTNIRPDEADLIRSGRWVPYDPAELVRNLGDNATVVKVVRGPSGPKMIRVRASARAKAHVRARAR